MPIYEYHCDHCDKNFEFIQKVSDPAKTECPECHKPSLKKLISSTSFQLKGTGWYVTDFRDKGKPPSKTETRKSENKSSSKSKDSSDKKE